MTALREGVYTEHPLELPAWRACARPLSSATVKRMAQIPLDPHGGEAPSIGIRLPGKTRQAVIEMATGRGQTISDFVRVAIERELELADSGPPDSG